VHAGLEGLAQVLIDADALEVDAEVGDVVCVAA